MRVNLETIDFAAIKNKQSIEFHYYKRYYNLLYFRTLVIEAVVMCAVDCQRVFIVYKRVVRLIFNLFRLWCEPIITKHKIFTFASIYIYKDPLVCHLEHIS